MEKLARERAENLRKERGEQSQVAFARKIGISKSSLNRIEIGEQNVTLETLDTICARLRCGIHDLLCK